MLLSAKLRGDEACRKASIYAAQQEKPPASGYRAGSGALTAGQALLRPLLSLRTSRNMTDGLRLRECRFRTPPKSDPEWLQQELVD